MEPNGHTELRRLAQTSGHRRYVFKSADAPSELAAIHNLLYRTFVLEIPRYEDPGTNYLIDKYHDRNHYFVALREGCVCGMIAVHDQAPFSVAATLNSRTILDSLGPPVLRGREHFVPMSLDLSSVPDRVERNLRRWRQ